MKIFIALIEIKSIFENILFEINIFLFRLAFFLFRYDAFGKRFPYSD